MKGVLHREWCGSPFNFQYPVFSLRLFSSWLHPLSHLHITSILPCVFPSLTCFKRLFICKIQPIQLACFLFVVCRIFLSSMTVYNNLVLTWSFHLSSPSSSSSTFQKFPGINDLLSKVSTFRYHSKLCCTSLVSSWNLILICWWRESSFCWTLHLPWQSWI